MTIAFAHYRNTPNIGDLMCAPYHYFDFSDKTVYDLADAIEPCEAVIYGGGAIEPLLRTNRIHDAVQANSKIAWGIGTSRRNKRQHGPLVHDLDLCGVREVGREVDVPNAFYVPCVSAMSPLFDESYEITQDVVFYTHGVYGLPDTGPAPRLNNRADTLEDAIRFIASGQTVVTNSFHGTYWAALLGRKVVCIPFSSKFYGFKYPPAYCLNGDWAEAMVRAVSYSSEALNDARQRNVDFHERVQNHIGSKRGAGSMNAVSQPARVRRPPSNPYAGLDARAHWKRAVVGKAPTEIKDWYRKKFDITDMRVSTAGSCFAQHIGRRLRDSGFKFIDTEPAPAVMLPQAKADYSYGLYSARFGNIYTTRQLRQLIERAQGTFKPVERVWKKGSGFVDPFRPTVEPDPYESIPDLKAARGHHMKRVNRMLQNTELFVFTLGLTEAWASVRDGTVFPVAPGVSGGEYNPDKHQLINLTYEDVVADLQWTIDNLRQINPNMHFLFTVSPVPLMATATSDHVAVATSHSKAILRAAAGHFAAKFEFVDYFPSLEIVSSHVTKGQFYDPSNNRDVLSDGVDHVMSFFFSQHNAPAQGAKRKTRSVEEAERLVCDEELLASFGSGS